MKRIRTYLKLTAKHLLRSGYIIRPYIKQVEKCYLMSEEQLYKYKEKKFLEIFRRAYDKSPFYHKLYTEAGIEKEDIKSLDDLKKLPIVTKEMVRQHAEEMLTVPKWKVLATHTSGTTGTPLELYEDWQSLWREQAYHISARKRTGYMPGDAFVSLRGHLDKTITHLFVETQNTLYLSSYNINSEHTEQYYNLLKEHKPKAIEGYPSTLYTLALLFYDNNLSVTIPITFTSSETLFPYQRELIHKVFNTEIFDLYGMTERTICLMEANNHEEYYEMPGYSINEYLEDGEICTSLINMSFPLIRYRSNDVIETENVNEDYWKIRSIHGRINGYLSLKDEFEIPRLDYIIKDVQNVKYAQLLINENYELSINIIPDKDFSEFDKNTIKNNFINRVGKELNYQINIIDISQIVTNKYEKYRYIVDVEKVFSLNDKRMRIKNIQGRLDDYIICKDGTKASTASLSFVVKGVPGIRYTQLHQSTIGTLEIRIVTNKNFDSKSEKILIGNIYNRIGKDEIEVSIKKIEEKDLIYSRSGKLKYIICNCK